VGLQFLPNSIRRCFSHFYLFPSYRLGHEEQYVIYPSKCDRWITLSEMGKKSSQQHNRFTEVCNKMHTFLTKHYETEPTYGWSACPTQPHSKLLLFSLCSPIPPGRCEAHILKHATTLQHPAQLIIQNHPAILHGISYELDSRHMKWTNT
jgi:hypothetical protein